MRAENERAAAQRNEELREQERQNLRESQERRARANQQAVAPLWSSPPPPSSASSSSSSSSSGSSGGGSGGDELAIAGLGILFIAPFWLAWKAAKITFTTSKGMLGNNDTFATNAGAALITGIVMSAGGATLLNAATNASKSTARPTAASTSSGNTTVKSPIFVPKRFSNITEFEPGTYGTYVVTGTPAEWIAQHPHSTWIGEEIGTVAQGSCLQYLPNDDHNNIDHVRLKSVSPNGRNVEIAYVPISSIQTSSISLNKCFANIVPHTPDIHPSDNRYDYKMNPHLYVGDIYYLSTRPDIGAVLIESDKALKVSEIVRDGPAHKAGLQKDDIITHINGREYNANAAKDYKNNITNLLYSRSPVILTISRGSLAYEVEVSKKVFTGSTSYSAAEEYYPLSPLPKPELKTNGRLAFGKFGTYVVTANETPWYKWDGENEELGEQAGTLPKGACLKYTSNARNLMNDYAKLMIDTPGGSVRWETGMVKIDDIAIGGISRSNCTADMDRIIRPVTPITIEQVNASITAQISAGTVPDTRPAPVTAERNLPLNGKFLVTASNLNLRVEPNTQRPVKGTLAQGSCVTVTADAAAEFVKITTIDMNSRQVYISGFVSADYLTRREGPDSYACRAQFTPR